MKLQKLIKLTVHDDQQAFDAAVRHLASMPRRAFRDRANLSWICVYETEDGKQRCVLGGMLDLNTPEKHAWAKTVDAGIMDIRWYEEDTELSDLPQGEYLVDINGVDGDLLAALQGTHDEADNWTNGGFVGWEALMDVAVNYGLDPKALQPYAVSV